MRHFRVEAFPCHPQPNQFIPFRSMITYNLEKIPWSRLMWNYNCYQDCNFHTHTGITNVIKIITPSKRERSRKMKGGIGIRRIFYFLFQSFTKTIVSFSEKAVVFKNNPLVLNFKKTICDRFLNDCFF